MLTNDVIQKLKQIGFSSYEAKAYYALLQKSPAIGYEISKISGIPTSKIYEVLNNLLNKDVITASASDPISYIPVPPEYLFKRLKQAYDSKIEELIKDIPQVLPISDIDITWNLKGRENVIEKISKLIKNAHQSLFLSIWPEEIDLFRPALEEAEKRGVDIIAAVFGDCHVEIKQLVNLEHCGISSLKRLGRRLTVVVSDSKEVIISEIGTKTDTVGISTTTPCIVLVAKEYIKHDIWGNYLIKALGEEQFKRMVETNSLLTSIITNR